VRLPVVHSKLAKSVVRMFIILARHVEIGICLFVVVDIIYIDLCITFITELRAPIMADGLGWVTLQLPTGGLSWVSNGLGWVGLRNFDPWPSLCYTEHCSVCVSVCISSSTNCCRKMHCLRVFICTTCFGSQTKINLISASEDVMS